MLDVTAMLICDRTSLKRMVLASRAFSFVSGLIGRGRRLAAALWGVSVPCLTSVDFGHGRRCRVFHVSYRVVWDCYSLFCWSCSALSAFMYDMATACFVARLRRVGCIVIGSDVWSASGHIRAYRVVCCLGAWRPPGFATSYTCTFKHGLTVHGGVCC